MAANIWAELIKQGFENFRAGINNLSQGTASIAQGANNGIQGFNPQNSGTGFIGNNMQAPQTSGLADMINNMKNKNEPFAAPNNPNLQNNVLGREIQSQTRPSFTPNANGSGGNSTGLSRAIQQQAPSFFDRLKF